MKTYTPLDWYWLDEAGGRVYASARQAIVTPEDDGYKAFIADGTKPTAWPRDVAGAVSDDELATVLDDIGTRNGLALVLPAPGGLSQYAAAKRYEVEAGGITVDGAPIATDRESQAMIGNAYAYVQAYGATSVSYKTRAGFVTLSTDQIKAIALAVGQHVQACFAAESAVYAAIHAKPPTITTVAQVDAVFSSIQQPTPTA